MVLLVFTRPLNEKLKYTHFMYRQVRLFTNFRKHKRRIESLAHDSIYVVSNGKIVPTKHIHCQWRHWLGTENLLHTDMAITLAVSVVQGIETELI